MNDCINLDGAQPIMMILTFASYQIETNRYFIRYYPYIQRIPWLLWSQQLF